MWQNHAGAAGGRPSGVRLISFDDDVRRASAEADPVGFIADLPDKVILDEVQRVPGLFTSLKAAVDRDRWAGRFILTGSGQCAVGAEIGGLVSRQDGNPAPAPISPV